MIINYLLLGVIFTFLLDFISDRLKDNPHMKQCYTKVPSIIRGTISAGNVDNHGFKEVLQKVGEAHPNSAVAQQHTRRTTKEIKTKQVLDKHRKLQARKKGRKNV